MVFLTNGKFLSNSYRLARAKSNSGSFGRLLFCGGFVHYKNDMVQFGEFGKARFDTYCYLFYVAVIGVCDEEYRTAALDMGRGIREQLFLRHQHAGALHPSHKLVHGEVDRILIITSGVDATESRLNLSTD
jgi:hypothetical protein